MMGTIELLRGVAENTVELMAQVCEMATSKDSLQLQLTQALEPVVAPPAPAGMCHSDVLALDRLVHQVAGVISATLSRGSGAAGESAAEVANETGAAAASGAGAQVGAGCEGAHATQEPTCVGVTPSEVAKPAAGTAGVCDPSGSSSGKGAKDKHSAEGSTKAGGAKPAPAHPESSTRENAPAADGTAPLVAASNATLAPTAPAAPAMGTVTFAKVVAHGTGNSAAGSPAAKVPSPGPKVPAHPPSQPEVYHNGGGEP